MEDILASIRRIIADDQSQGTRPGYGNGVRRNGSQPVAPEAETGERIRTAYDDVLDLARLSPTSIPSQSPRSPVVDPTHSATEHQPIEAADRGEPHDPGSDHFEAPAVDVSSHPSRLAEASSPENGHDEAAGIITYDDDAGEEALLSEPLGASVLSAFETLAATVVLQNTPMLESVMRDLLRPLLKTWLDDNLPALVERLVRIEIERVARGPRS